LYLSYIVYFVYIVCIGTLVLSLRFTLYNPANWLQDLLYRKWLIKVEASIWVVGWQIA